MAGVDVGAKADVQNLVEEYLAKGGAVVLIAYDLDELVQMSDRVGVVAASGQVRWHGDDDLTVDHIHHALEAAS
jgi:ribose transport system ATP-binding protein